MPAKKKANNEKYTEGKDNIKVLGTVPFSDTDTLVVRELPTRNGDPKIDVRIFVEKDTFTGWSKGGFRTSKETLKKVSAILGKVK